MTRIDIKFEPPAPHSLCPVCNGRGEYIRFNGYLKQIVPCSWCLGKGRVGKSD